MTSTPSPDPTPDLPLEMQPELQPKPQPTTLDLVDEFEEEIETALPALDVIPHPAPVEPVAATAVNTESVAAVSDAEPAPEPATAEPNPSSLTDQLLANFFKLWQKAVGEPAEPNRAIVGLSLLSLTTLVILSRIYGFIDQLPVLAPAFELVGFFYSISVLIKYIRSAEDRSNLTQTVDDIKKKLLG